MSEPTRWEFKVVRGHDWSPEASAKQLNLLGVEGWELACVEHRGGGQPPLLYMRRRLELRPSDLQIYQEQLEHT